MKRLIVICLALLALASSAEAATYYVATTGTDNAGCGSVGSPCLTIEYAYEHKVSAGDTIIVKPGTHTGGGRHVDYGRVLLNKQGTAESPITIRSETYHGAILDGGANINYPYYFWFEGPNGAGEAKYNIIDGFEIKNTYRCSMVNWGSYNTVINNDLHNAGTGWVQVGDCGGGIVDDGLTTGNHYEGNYIHDNPSTGAYLQGDNDTFINNILVNNGHQGLQIRGSNTTTNMKAYNNVFASNGRDGIAIWQNIASAEIKNNIFYQNTHSAILLLGATGSGLVIDNNISYGNGQGNLTVQDSTIGYTSTRWNHNDPRFVNAAAGDFHLQAGSPAIDAGLTESAVPTDFEGVPRPQGAAYDIGAYEYGGAAISACAAPFPSGFFCGDYYRSTSPGLFTTLYGNIASEGNGTTPFLNYSSFDATLGGSTRCGQQNLCAVRWQGNYTFSEGNYTFSVTSDDGFRLYIDGTLVMDHWVDQAATAYTYGQAMTAGVHLIKVEYYENTWDAVAVVGWVQDTLPPPAGPRSLGKGAMKLSGAASLR